MASLLIIEAQGPARQTITAALDGLGYSIRCLDGLKSWKKEDQSDVSAPDLILLSLDCLDGLGPEGVGSLYARGGRPVPVVVWSRDLPRARIISWMPPEVVLAGIFEGVPSSAEVLLLVFGQLPPSEPGLAVQRLLRLLAAARAPVRTITPRGTHEISDFALPRALVSLAGEGWSGSVTVEPLRGRTQRFWFEEGALVLASDGLTGELLREARRRGIDRKGTAPTESFEILRDELVFLRRTAGLSTAERSSLVEWYSAKLIAKACGATEGRVHVVDYAEPEFRLGLGLSMDVRSLLLASARSAPLDVQERKLMQAAWFVLPSLPRGDEKDSWDLDGPDLALRNYLSTNKSTRLTVGAVTEALVSSGDQEEHIVALLARLSEMGYLRFVGAPFDDTTMTQLAALSAACLQGQRADHFTFLDVPRTATKKVIDAAVLASSRKWHPDALAGSHPRVQSLAARVFALLREAADTLGNEDNRQVYVEDLEDGLVGRGGQDPERARVLMAKGRISLKGKRFTDAAAEFESAAAADPSLFEARLLRQWALFLADPDQVATSIVALEALARDGAANADLWGFLGRMVLRSGDEERARSCFKRAIKMDPGHTDSQRQLRLLLKRSGPSGGSPKKGFWSRFRGR